MGQGLALIRGCAKLSDRHFHVIHLCVNITKHIYVFYIGHIINVITLSDQTFALVVYIYNKYRDVMVSEHITSTGKICNCGIGASL